MISRSRYLSIIGAPALIFIPLASLASPADLYPPTFHACAPAPQLVRVVDAVAPRERGRQISSLRRLSSLPLSIVGSAGRYRVQVGSDEAVTVDAPVDIRACQAVDQTALHLLNGGAVPGQNAAAIAAVLTYRESNSWPYGAAHLDDARTTLDVQTRNGRVIVAILDYKTLFTPHLDCSGEEWYRVDVQTFKIEPFDGCGAGTALNRILPTLRDLPN